MADPRLAIHELIAPEHIGAAAPPGSISERIARLDMSMLVLMGGRERTASEFADLLAASGFSLVQVLPTASPRRLLVARPTTSEPPIPEM